LIEAAAKKPVGVSERSSDKDYQVPFAFTGKLHKVTLTINRPKLSPSDIKKLEAAQRNNRASE